MAISNNPKADKGKKLEVKEKQKQEYSEEEAARLANKGCLVALAGVLSVLAIVLLVGFIYINGELKGDRATATGTVTMDIPSGSGGRTVASLLKEAGMISNENIFRFYVRFNGANQGFQAGRFTLEPGMDYDEIIKTLSQTPPERPTIKVTFPEGITVIRFGEILAKNGICTVDEFVNEANNGDFSDIEFFNRLKEDYDPNTFMLAEGYLAPNTYEFYTDENVHTIVRRLYQQFDKEMQQFYPRMDELGLSLRETITLASLIEEEAGNPENQKPVSQVFWNRLSDRWPQGTLGSDVTFRYIQDWIARQYNGDLTVAPQKEDYKKVPEELFYAYYTGDEDPKSRRGLTAGPISCPGVSAIEAALYPDEAYSKYFYFLTDFYGNYYYAETYEQHLVNVQTMKAKNAQYEKEKPAESASTSNEE